jgi:uncharacterized membrane protein
VKGVKKFFGVLFPILFIGFFAVLGAVSGQVDDGTGSDKSFELDSIDVTAALRRDGVLLVREEVTYDFDGTFNVGTRDFDSGPWEITNIRAFEGDRPRATITDTPTLFEWDISPASGTHTYELRYEVRNAVIAWPDVVELNWQWVGRDVPEGVGRHEVALRLPGDGEGIRAWAHGPLSGTIDVRGRTVHTHVDDLPAFTFLETRVIAPRRRFGNGLPRGQVGQTEPRGYASECDLLRGALQNQATENPSLTQAQIDQILADSPQCQGEDLTIETEPQQDRIVAEETALAEEANRARADYEKEQQEKEDRRRALAAAAPFLIGGVLLLAWVVWRKWGKEPDLTSEIDYWREVPDDPPAVAIALEDWGSVDTDALSATIVDLAQRGYLTITETEKDHTFAATDKSRDGLLAFERMAMTKLFENGNETSQSQLTAWAKANRTSAASWLSSFTKAVVKCYEAKGYQVKGQAAGWVLYLLLVAVLGGFAAIAIANEAFAAGGAAIGAAVLLLGTMILLRRRTAAGAQRYAEWNGLRKFLKDFSQLQDAPSGHLALYERYLVAAVALGVADELIDALKVRIPEVANDPTFATWYVGSRAGTNIGGFSSLGDFSSDFSSATASSFRPPSSSSSSGGGFSGGFSGGGGGGGGGGGFGAR